jgi:nucleotidyltransferase/DNA polymerase involved in DNA repair
MEHNMKQRRVAFIRLPHILAEVSEQRQAGPLVVVSGLSPKGVVLDYSRELQSGLQTRPVPAVKRGAFLKDIEAAAPGVRVVTADFERLEDAHAAVVHTLKDYSPQVTAPKAGEYCLDLTGTKRIFGREIDTCAAVLERINRELGFTARAGIGSNLLIGSLACAVVPEGGVYDISVQAEREFILPLSVRLLPALPTGLSRGTVDELVSNYGIGRVEDLLPFSMEDLRCLFGREGDILYRCARGEAGTRQALSERKTGPSGTLKREVTISSERNDDWSVRRWFFTLVFDLCRDLRELRVFPGRFFLAVVYQDDYRHTKEGRLAAPSFFEGDVYRQLLPCLDRALQRRTCVKKLVLSFSRFRTPSLQFSLFGDASRPSRLACAFDRITQRFGGGTIRYGA